MAMQQTTAGWMTQRDRAIYEFLRDTVPYASTGQVSELFFRRRADGVINKAPLTMAHKRLKIIVDNMPDMIVMRRFADDNIYCVSKKEHSRVLTNERIAHGLALVDAYIRILDFSRENAPKLEFFRAEYKLLNGCIPDMVLAFRRGDDSRRILYVEYDRGTKTIVSQRKKVDSYKRYFEDRQYLDEEFQPGDVKPRIVFLCESPFRVKNITQAIPGVCACDNVPSLFLF